MQSSSAIHRVLFWLSLLGILVLGFTRSWVTTRSDGFTIDEGWHAAAGASYVRSADYRLNPEHPPLVKLWVGAALLEGGFRLADFRPMPDKEGEREFINEAIYRLNEPDAVQQRVRVAMLAFYALLMAALGLRLERSFGVRFSLIVTALLLFDPTIAAHLPVVLTDLPLALLSLLVFLQAAAALKSWKPLDLALLSLLLGLTLAAKHSGLVTALALAALAVGSVALPLKSRAGSPAPSAVPRRLASVVLVFAGAYAVLWAFYGFRYLESPGLDPSALTFNRPMADKIGDLSSPTQRTLLGLAVDFHLLPRAYLWGLADILRAGIEGRQDALYVLGNFFEGKTPWYSFPAVLMVKVPLGISALAVLGAIAVARRRVPEEWRAPLLGLLGWGAFYLLFLLRGNSGYAGVRHALPVLPVVGVLAAVAVVGAWASSRLLLRGAVAVLLLAALVSARPALRPWEYYNELVGGSAGAWHYFADDGLDNSQRTRELARYYDEHLRGDPEPVYDYYGVFSEEVEARKLSFRALEDDPSDSDVLRGTVFLSARELAPRPSYDFNAFRAAEPTARLGNLLVYRGEFRLPWLRAARKWSSVDAAQAEENPDPRRIAALLEEVVALYPNDIRAWFELGNLLLEQGSREAALAAYRRAREFTPESNSIIGLLDQQIASLSSGAAVASLRNPWLE